MTSTRTDQIQSCCALHGAIRLSASPATPNLVGSSAHHTTCGSRRPRHAMCVMRLPLCPAPAVPATWSTPLLPEVGRGRSACRPRAVMAKACALAATARANAPNGAFRNTWTIRKWRSSIAQRWVSPTTCRCLTSVANSRPPGSSPAPLAIRCMHPLLPPRQRAAPPPLLCFSGRHTRRSAPTATGSNLSGGSSTTTKPAAIPLEETHRKLAAGVLPAWCRRVAEIIRFRVSLMKPDGLSSTLTIIGRQSVHPYPGVARGNASAGLSAGNR